MYSNPDHPNLRVRIQEKLKFEPKQKCSGSSTKQMIPQKFIIMLVQKKSGGKKKPWFHGCHTGNEMIFGSNVVFTDQRLEKAKEVVTEKELRSGRRFFGRVERTAGM
jgi:hypothetical protein